MAVLAGLNQNINDIIRNYKTIAVVGLSDNPYRSSNSISQLMQRSGYRVIPVNPLVEEVLGEKSFATLSDIPEPVDLVVVFRRPEYVDDIMKQAIAIRAKAVWMQSGIINPEAAQMGLDAGVEVVMIGCWPVISERSPMTCSRALALSLVPSSWLPMPTLITILSSFGSARWFLMPYSPLSLSETSLSNLSFMRGVMA